jgi:adenylate cyclase
MMAVSMSFVLIVLIITLIMAFLTVPRQTGRPVTDPTSAIALQDFIFDTAPLKALVVWYFVVLITQVFLLMNKKFGHGTFWHFITGRYNVPKREQRVFMFLDINSSTSLAEQLGSEKYHSFLRDFFSDITDPIINHYGSIYQYVGDEVVISWPIDTTGIGARPLLCFSEIKEFFLRERKVYLQRYGITPSFKAGVHAGHVVTGEIGIIKRDVTYSGDVLNATARIRDLCKEFDADLMVSQDFLDLLQNERRFTFIDVGKNKLRGKEVEMNLYIVQDSQPREILENVARAWK